VQLSCSRRAVPEPPLALPQTSPQKKKKRKKKKKGEPKEEL